MARAAYFYPFSTRCPVRQARARLVTGHELVSEHRLLLAAKPAWKAHDVFGREFGPHLQPKMYSLGMRSGPTTADGWDDADPEVVRRHLELMSYARMDTVIFDVYGGYRRSGGLKEFATEMQQAPLGFADQIEYSHCGVRIGCNICLSSPRVQLPIPDPHLQATIPELRKDYEISPESLCKFVEYLASTFMIRNSYWRYQGRPVLFLYDAIKLTRLEPTFTTKKLAHAIAGIRRVIRDITGQDVYLVGLVFKHEDAVAAARLEFDALSSYILLPLFDFARERPVQLFADLLDETISLWKRIIGDVSLPFYPSVVPGWDAWPRVAQGWHISEVRGGYPATPIVVGGNPTLFSSMAGASAKLITSQHAKMPRGEPLLTTLVACWNEMSEGCSVLPVVDPVTGERDCSLLEALRAMADKSHHKESIQETCL